MGLKTSKCGSSVPVPYHSSVTMMALMNCPKCGVEMEPIETTVEQLPLRELLLCPSCYLVTWTSESGRKFQQGVPVPQCSRPPGELKRNEC